jgi:PAS domain S-box-containing protein
MKNSITPTQRELVMRDNDFIVSKTDLSGRISYCNEIFIAMSGYTERELIGAQHNIVRHPDMPRGVFKLLWDTIKGGKECFAYVKNLSKDGSHYWVFANITPDLDERHQPTGYFSVRRKPRPGAIETISGIYAEMLAEETRAGPRDAPTASLARLNEILKQRGAAYEEFILSL